MKKKKCIVLSVCVLLLMPWTVKGAAEESETGNGTVENAAADKEHDAEFGMWGYVTVNKHIVSGLSLSVSGEVRSANAMQDLGLWWITPSLTFRFNDYVNVFAGYRYVRTLSDTGYESGHRWYAGATVGIGFGPVHLSVREMIDQTHYTDRPKDYPSRMNTYLRSRLRADFKFGSFFLCPYADVENFLYIIGYRKGETGYMRYTVGIRIPVAHAHSFDVFYRHQHYYGSSRPNDHVLGLGYSLSL